MKDEKSYNPQSFETQIYEKWEKENCFYADPNSKKPAFCIIMPPPNVTSMAHIGHAMDVTMQDILSRYKRMKGYEVLWQPGTDHAAIATEIKIVEKLRKEGKTKEGIGRVAFDKEAWDWYNFYGDKIMRQFRRIGCSADWSKARFTMDEKSTNAVLETFIRLYDKGLIYRGTRLTNWCSTCKSVISDDEVEYSDEESSMWHIRYPFADGSGHIVVATTRPETIFGDMAVAVNPEDERYKNIVGKELVLPLTDRKIPIIADSYVEKDFGTGMVKITPAHDPNDYEVGKRHNLEVLSVIEKDGKLNRFAGKFEGMQAKDAREKIVEELKSQNLIEKIEPYTHSVGHCYRCHNVIEPLVTKQWYVAMKELAKPAIECVKNGELTIYAKRFEKNYFHWLENIQDWCISRQLWTGHRIPIYYCDDCGEVYASKQPSNCPKCNSNHFHQDEDVLDTWFSSALWPFSTLGWPEKTKTLEKFYPTSVLVTGYDILTHWVTKMVYMGIECTGQVPFKYTLIHGLVRDEQGRKMSKSLGNGIDPIKVADEHGADALRLALIKDLALGLDTRMGETKIVVAKQFINKLWNASKFVDMNKDGIELLNIEKCKLGLFDKWILNELNELILNVTTNIEKFEMGIALTNIYNFVLDDFCDWFIEVSKPMLNADASTKQNAVSILNYVLENILKLLHPYIPFVTEYIYESNGGSGLLCKQSFPEYNENFKFEAEKEKVESIFNLIKGIRSTKLEQGIDPYKQVVITTTNKQIFDEFLPNIKKLAFIEIVEQVENIDGTPIVNDLVPCAIKINIDKTQLLEKLQKDLKDIEFEIERSVKMLSNEKFVAKAPQNLVQLEKEKLERNKAKKESILLSIKNLG